jgi:hydroxyacylglutathione hydrolase
MIFKQIKVGMMDNFNYIIADPETKEAAVIDSSFEEGKLFSALSEEGLKLTMILLTHTHFDHIEALGRVVEKFDVPVYVHPNERHAIEKFTSNIKTVDEGDEISIGSLKVKVLFTPGHTPGGITFLVSGKLITGDALFVEGCGRIDLPGGDIDTMWKTLQRFKSLDENLEVYPGHDYGSQKSSTIKHEKENNPYLKASKEEFFSIR